MISNEAFQVFVDAIHHANDEVGLAAAASRMTEAIGFRWFAYLSLGGQRPALLSTYPASWTDHYFANAFDEIDPVVSASRDEIAPFFWGALDAVKPADREQSRLFDDASSLGIRSGITVPFKGPEGRFAAFTLSSDEASPAQINGAEELTTFVQLCGLQFHNVLATRITRFMPEHRVWRLTGRQRLCLAASAEGRSAKQTARVVGLTPRTVEHHLEEAKKRLEAETLPHAVALAVRKGLIS